MCYQSENNFQITMFKHDFLAFAQTVEVELFFDNVKYYLNNYHEEFDHYGFKGTRMNARIFTPWPKSNNK